MQVRTILLTLMLLYCTSILHAENILTDDSSDNTLWQPQIPFKEEKTILPEKIDLNNLQEFQVGVNDPRFRFFIERGSFKTGSDKVTRFVVIIRSNRGVINSSYEGMRCGERLYKVFAYGNAEKFFPAMQTQWQTIPKDESTDYHAALYNDLICNLLTGQSNPPDAIFRAMAENRTLNGD